MLKTKYIIKDIENDLIFGSGFIHTLTYDLGDNNIFVGGPLQITVFVVQLIYLMLLLNFALFSFKSNTRQSFIVIGILAQAIIAALGEYVFHYNYDLSNQVTAFCILE